MVDPVAPFVLIFAWWSCEWLFHNDISIATLNNTVVKPLETIQLDHPTLGHAVIELNKGLVSSGGAVGYSATGVPTNLTSLLDHVQSIQVTDNVYEQLRERYEFQERGPVEVKGKGPLTTYLLLGRR